MVCSNKISLYQCDIYYKIPLILTSCIIATQIKKPANLAGYLISGNF